ncbi:MAG: hypothetical protein V7675_01935 [Hyphomonas sp.]|uniref:hypothetical protein n=1 Tax=Hyphomonas sp. TaxID=87 RepID=UPI00300200A9
MSENIESEVADDAPRMRKLEIASHVSEIVSSIAVVVTLVYLGFQIHQNTAQLQRAENNATQDQWQAVRLFIAGNEGAARIWHAGLTGEPLDDVDQMRFEALLAEHIWSTYHIWDRSQRGVFERGEFSRGAAIPLVRLLCTASGDEYWQRMKNAFHPDFVAEMDASIGKATADGQFGCAPPAPQP